MGQVLVYVTGKTLSVIDSFAMFFSIDESISWMLKNKIRYSQKIRQNRLNTMNKNVMKIKAVITSSELRNPRKPIIRINKKNAAKIDKNTPLI